MDSVKETEWEYPYVPRSLYTVIGLSQVKDLGVPRRSYDRAKSTFWILGRLTEMTGPSVLCEG
jgi:hypothetical protein